MKKLIVYITSGFPSSKFTIDVSLSLAEAGVDILELGIPFSDPIADGPIIEEAGLKSLKNGFKIKNLFEISSKISNNIDTLWMGYFNIFYKYGMKNIIQEAKNNKISGFIIPDLPLEETFPYKKDIIKNGLSLINFISPLSGKNRIKKITEDKNQKFIYLVAYSGITGKSKNTDLTKVIENIREATKTPIYIGFGVNKNNAKEKVKNLDGVIVGTAFIKILLNERLSNNQKLIQIVELAKEIKERINS